MPASLTFISKLFIIKWSVLRKREREKERKRGIEIGKHGIDTRVIIIIKCYSLEKKKN